MKNLFTGLLNARKQNVEVLRIIPIMPNYKTANFERFLFETHVLHYTFIIKTRQRDVNYNNLALQFNNDGNELTVSYWQICSIPNQAPLYCSISSLS